MLVSVCLSKGSPLSDFIGSFQQRQSVLQQLAQLGVLDRLARGVLGQVELSVRFFIFVKPLPEL